MLGLENMVKGMIPPEILAALTPEKIKELLAALTPEKIKEYGDQVNAFITIVREQLDKIETNQVNLLNALVLSDLNTKLDAILLKLEQANDSGRRNKRGAAKSADSSPLD